MYSCPLHNAIISFNHFQSALAQVVSTISYQEQVLSAKIKQMELGVSKPAQHAGKSHVESDAETSSPFPNEPTEPHPIVKGILDFIQ